MKINDKECSCYHPFIKDGGKIIIAKYLSKGDILHGNIKITNIEKISSKKSLYNIETKNHHYYVGNILVHDGREVA
jgi:hypothetical protein